LSKLILEKDVESFFSNLKEKQKKIAFTNGCFDILHAGHVDYLEKTKKMVDVLVIGLNSDDSVKRLKGEKRPVVKEKYRIKALSGLASVDYIAIFNEDTPLNLIKKIKPDVLVKGSDWKNKGGIIGEEFVKKIGGEVKYVDLLPNISTSLIIEKIKEK
jgi:rfaE bifunctional protein nucleotidyltransferase chain/domain